MSVPDYTRDAHEANQFPWDEFRALQARVDFLEEQRADLVWPPECRVCPDCRDDVPCAYPGECWDCVGYAQSLARLGGGS